MKKILAMLTVLFVQSEVVSEDKYVRVLADLNGQLQSLTQALRLPEAEGPQKALLEHLQLVLNFPLEKTGSPDSISHYAVTAFKNLITWATTVAATLEREETELSLSLAKIKQLGEIHRSIPQQTDAAALATFYRSLDEAIVEVLRLYRTICVQVAEYLQKALPSQAETSAAQAAALRSGVDGDRIANIHDPIVYDRIAAERYIQEITSPELALKPVTRMSLVLNLKTRIQQVKEGLQRLQALVS